MISQSTIIPAHSTSTAVEKRTICQSDTPHRGEANVIHSDSSGDSGTATAWPFHMASRQATAYGDARAIRRAVLARLMTTERALLRRWCIGVAVVYGGLFFAALIAILVLAARASLSDP